MNRLVGQAPRQKEAEGEAVGQAEEGQGLEAKLADGADRVQKHSKFAQDILRLAMAIS